MGVAERTEEMRTLLRALTDRLMRVTAVFPGTHHVEPTPDELAALERRDNVEEPVDGEPGALEDQQHPPSPRLEHGHPKL